MPTVRLRLLGGFQVSADGESLAAINAPRLQSLIAYLAMHRGVAHTRQQLAFLLWPDSTEEQARTNLRKLLLQWRQSSSALDGCVRDGGQTLQWRTDAPATVDVAEFEDAMTGGEFERAVSLYAGDLLPDCYDEWVAPERERLSRLLTGALEKLISTLEGQRDYRGAITQAQHLLQHDPLNEVTIAR
jgi:DNA-binding SARP family transcriptional activator